MTPMVVSMRELATARPAEDQAVILYLSGKDLERLTEGVKPLPDKEVRGVGLEIVPLPGEQGFLGFPVCGPDDTPVFRGGTWQCVRTQIRPQPTDRAPSGPAPCGFSLKNGVFGCTGICANNLACVAGQVKIRGLNGLVGMRLVCACPRPMG